MRDYNRVILMGNLAQDPEQSMLSKGRTATNFVVAVNRVYTGMDGEQGSEVSFIDCTAYGPRAKTIKDYCYKGRPIFIEGRLRQEKWEKDGKKHSRIRVIVENFSFIDSKKQEESIPIVAGNSDTNMEMDILEDFSTLDD